MTDNGNTFRNDFFISDSQTGRIAGARLGRNSNENKLKYVLKGSGFIDFLDLSFCRTGLLFLLMSAAYTDWKKGRIYNLQIAAALSLGIVGLTVFEPSLFGGELLLYFIRVLVVCTVFFPLFLWKLMGAGDIKLMAVCVGILGVSDGIFVIFLGLFLAAAVSARRMILEGRLWERMTGLAAFIVEVGRERKNNRYRVRYKMQHQKGDVIHLGPYLFMGYCLFLIVYRG